MLQFNLEIAITQAAVGLGEVAAFFKQMVAVVFGADEHDLSVTAVNDGILIIEQAPTCSRLQVAQSLAVGQLFLLIIPAHVVVIVVVAEHREHAVGGMQLCQQFAIG